MDIEVENGVRIFVHDLNPDEGSRPVLFIHGWPVNHKMFEYQFNVLPHYGYRCLGLDVRGFGRSDKPWHGYSYDRLADDLYMVLETMALQDVTLIGFSIGGAIAIRYMARHHGRRIARLALVSAAAPVFTKRPDYPYGLPVDQVNTLIRQTYKDRPQMLADFGRMFFNRSSSCPFSDWFHTLGLEASSHATIAAATSLRNEDLRADLPWIRVPTAIFHGLHDQIVPFPSAQALQRGIAGSCLYPFSNSGHGVIIDEMDSFNAALLGFLS
ncbi:alpha/beta fold hydrolase [Desmospora activa]|uniref:Non-heme chloroperoxidase n=1 Tax=Desmospora activa DSM 45169 TaxID=1121389 RepID=A0A2T4Z700_9BACL|nr:alpha/beta hydrolase [Desmospora activa]PTM57646.1 non-heme chloroperoxidase [Desmospora activa DSM 45169]